MSAARDGVLFCFCGPAASGKSTAARAMVESDSQLLLSVSTTTRNPRPGEVDGEAYHFVGEEEFECRVAAGRFFEHAVFNGKRYGTERMNVEHADGSGRDLLLDIDVQGARAIKSLLPQRTVVVFLFPPSGEVLLERFRARGSENAEAMAARLNIARGEVNTLRDTRLSDYFVVNDELARTVADLRAIVRAERLKLARVQPSVLDGVLRLPAVMP